MEPARTPGNVNDRRIVLLSGFGSVSRPRLGFKFDHAFDA
jgi:hypothetical protein